MHGENMTWTKVDSLRGINIPPKTGANLFRENVVGPLLYGPYQTVITANECTQRHPGAAGRGYGSSVFDERTTSSVSFACSKRRR
jgi:hypothetical protein